MQTFEQASQQGSGGCETDNLLSFPQKIICYENRADAKVPMQNSEPAKIVTDFWRLHREPDAMLQRRQTHEIIAHIEVSHQNQTVFRMNNVRFSKTLFQCEYLIFDRDQATQIRHIREEAVGVVILALF